MRKLALSTFLLCYALAASAQFVSGTVMNGRISYAGAPASSAGPAFTNTFTIANLAMDTTNVIDVGSNMRTNAGAASLAFNRPAIDSSHVLWTAITNGVGTNVTQSSSTTGNGIITTNAATTPYWVANPTLPPLAGANSLYFQPGNQLSIGNNLLWERTQKWTASWLQNKTGKPVSGDFAAIVFSSAVSTPFPCIECWEDGSGHLRVKLIHDVANNVIDVAGTTDLTDGVTHFVAVTYDGSSTAAGVKIYIDTKLESVTVLADSLSLSIISPGPFIVGNQNLVTNGDYFGGYLANLMIEVTNRPDTYITNYSVSSLPPTNAFMALYLKMDDAGGTSVKDSSTNNFTCTLNANQMWATGSNSIPAFMGDSALSFSSSANAVAFANNAAYNLASNYTISAWANSYVGPPGNLFYNYNGGTGGFIVGGWTGTDEYWVANAFRDFTTVTAPYWHHCSVRMTAGGTVDWIVDGAIKKTLTSIPNPIATAVALELGKTWNTGSSFMGYMSLATISITNRSNAYETQFSTRFPAAGIASLANPGTAIASGGGDLGSTLTVTNFMAAFATPSTSTVKFRIAAGANAAAATAAKLLLGFTALSSGNNQVNVNGRNVDFDLQLIPSTDPLTMFTPAVTNVTLVYH